MTTHNLTSESASEINPRHHRGRRMLGRNPNEAHRAATPLELLFDLVSVIAFGAAANELAHAIQHEHIQEGIIAFSFATFAISWAWINFTWFASAFDNDDWIYRLTTMLQMAGALIFALGLPDMYDSIVEHHSTLDNDVMVIGYVIMRVAMVMQWWRVGKQDKAQQSVARSYIVSIVVAQALWCFLAFTNLSISVTFALMVIPFAIEIFGPFLAETRIRSTPWHAHHIAERYGLLIIICLGEGLIGTMTSVRVLAEDGLNWDASVLAFAGTALTFGVWWSYFIIPSAEILHVHRNRSFLYGYGHMAVFGCIVAIGAGIHVAAYYLDHDTHLGTTAVTLTMVVPIALFYFLMYGGYSLFTRSFDRLHLLLVAITAVALVIPVVMAGAGVSLVWCLVALSFVPWVTVAGYELAGWRHNESVLARDNHPTE